MTIIPDQLLMIEDQDPAYCRAASTNGETIGSLCAPEMKGPQAFRWSTSDRSVRYSDIVPTAAWRYFFAWNTSPALSSPVRHCLAYCRAFRNRQVACPNPSYQDAFPETFEWPSALK